MYTSYCRQGWIKKARGLRLTSKLISFFPLVFNSPFYRILLFYLLSFQKKTTKMPRMSAKKPNMFLLFSNFFIHISCRNQGPKKWASKQAPLVGTDPSL